MDKIAYGIHVKEHDSVIDPREDCAFCVAEAYRRNHRCHGDGASTIGIPQMRKEDRPTRREDSQAVELQPVPELKGIPVVKTKTKLVSAGEER